MIFRKFIGWIVSWTSLQLDENKKSRMGKDSFMQLEKKIQELEKLIEHMSAENDEIQTAFFRNIYHEIRTPMNSILGFSSLLHNENLTSEKRNLYTDQVWKSSIVFLQFIDDLVEASLLETHRPKLEPVWFYVNDMMQEVYQSCNRHRHIMEKTNIVLLFNKANNLQNIHVETDRKRLLQMLEYVITDSMMGIDRGIIELGFIPILNNGLSFYIKITPVGKKENLSEPVIRRVGMNAGSFGLQIRKRMADKLMDILGGAITAERNNGITTLRIVLSQVNMCSTGTITDNKSNNKRIAI